jgi:TRAP-type mannitol/chloroaromatic compound transport system substrate-binding protein
MNAQQVNAWMYAGDGYELWKEIYADFNLVPFVAGNTGVQMGGWFNKEINSISDFKGLKMRMPGLGGKVLNKAGATTVLVAGGELYTNLERGVIDATEWIGPYHDYIMGFHKIAKYYYTPGWHEPGTILEFMMTKRLFDSLPSDIQEILKIASSQLNIWTLAQLDAKNYEYLSKIKKESSAEIRAFPDDVIANLRSNTKEVLDELVSNNKQAKKVYASYKTFQDNITQWSNISEKQFYNKLQA